MTAVSAEPRQAAAADVPAVKAEAMGKVIDDRVYGDHRLLIGEIVAVHWLKEVFMEDGSLDLTAVNPALYIGNDHYVSIESGAIRTLAREFCVERLSR